MLAEVETLQQEMQTGSFTGFPPNQPHLVASVFLRMLKALPVSLLPATLLDIQHCNSTPHFNCRNILSLLVGTVTFHKRY